MSVTTRVRTLLAMADQKPPYLAGDERAVFCALLRYQRESVVRKIEGLDDETARRPMVPSGASLMWLVKHLAFAETIWVVQRFAAEDVELPDAAVRDDDTVDAAVDLYRSTWQQVDAIVTVASLDDLCVNARASTARPAVGPRVPARGDRAPTRATPTSSASSSTARRAAEARAVRRRGVQAHLQHGSPTGSGLGGAGSRTRVFRVFSGLLRAQPVNQSRVTATHRRPAATPASL